MSCEGLLNRECNAASHKRELTDIAWYGVYGIGHAEEGHAGRPGLRREISPRGWTDADEGRLAFRWSGRLSLA